LSSISIHPGVVFVGGGNMGRALAGGLVAQGTAREALAIIDVDAAARERIMAELGIRADGQPTKELISAAHVLVLAVKPQHMRATAAALRTMIAGQLVLSIAAGIRIADLSRWLGGHARIVRAMPNTPALVRRGITGLCAGPGVDDDGRRAAERVLAAVGETLWCKSERQLDAITAVSASGPAYLFHYLEAMIAAAEALGFESAEARRLAYATASGAIALAEASSDSPAVLRAQVTSKGGTTEAALAVLGARDVAGAYREAIRAADARAAELGDQFGHDGA